MGYMPGANMLLDTFVQLILLLGLPVVGLQQQFTMHEYFFSAHVVSHVAPNGGMRIPALSVFNHCTLKSRLIFFPLVVQSCGRRTTSSGMMAESSKTNHTGIRPRILNAQPIATASSLPW